MALITLASRSHVLGQLFDVLFPYSRKADLQVCQFFIRQENILVTAIGVGRVPRFRAYLLYLSLYLYLFLSLYLYLWWTNVGQMSATCPERRKSLILKPCSPLSLGLGRGLAY